MNIQVSITKNPDQTVSIKAPFSAYNNLEFRSKGGKFKNGAWEFYDTPAVDEMISELWGTSEKIVTVHVPYESDLLISYDGAYSVGGYVVCQRRSRDVPVTWADGVWLVSGSVPSRGGSAKNPAVEASDNAVFALTVREDFALKNNLNIIQEIKSSQSDLEIEKQKLLARLAEIDQLLLDK